MKIKLIILFLLISTCGYTQWVQQYQVTGFVNLREVEFLNENTGWTCGDGGLILKTTNQGQNWFIQNSGVPQKRLHGIEIIDSNIIYCIGYFETILKSTNGGGNWMVLSDGEISNSGSYFRTFFINKDTGWICGTGQKVLKTTNGALSFDTIQVPNSGFMDDMYFRNYNDGIICGDGGTIFRTTNGGNTWFEVIVPLGFQAAGFDMLSVVDTSIVFCIGQTNNKLYRSLDFGLTWDSVSRAPHIDDTYAIYFVNSDTGWIGGTSGFMLKTTNGGENWFMQNMSQFNQGFIHWIHFVNDTTGWAVGAATKILFTNTGGDPKVGIQNISNQIPNDFILEQNYPNPFNNSTNINFSIRERSLIKLEVYDLLGREVAVLINEFRNAGSYVVGFNASALASGIYYYKIKAGTFEATKRMVLIK